MKRVDLLARLLTVVCTFAYGNWLATWEVSFMPLWAVQLFCVAGGLGIPFVGEALMWSRRREIEAARDRTLDAQIRVGQALNEVANTLSKALDGGSIPSRNINPECWRN